MKDYLLIRRFGRLSIILITVSVFLSGCQQDPPVPVSQGEPASLSQVPAVRLYYRYEADVPAPEIARVAQAENDSGVSADFSQNRPNEFLDRTISSPDKRRILAIYHFIDDLPSEFRLDMYSADGELINKITPETMAVHFPDTIVWSPDSANLAFVAMIRGAQGEKADAGGQSDGSGTVVPAPDVQETPVRSDDADITPPLPPEEANLHTGADLPETTELAPTPTPPTGILSFRSEQIYLVGADGTGLRPLTQNEGLIYFYYAWSPDSSILVALAATVREWQFLQVRAEGRGEAFVPVGRPRLIEKNGRERRLDDGLTAVRPAWSPDSAKVAAAYDTQVRIYDADGLPPTQAAVPLRNSLLLSSQAFDRSQQQELGAVESNSEANQNPAGPTTLPDASTLASFTPIVALEWPIDNTLYFQTAFVKRMLNQADSATSFARWHRLLLSVQPRDAPVQ